MNRACHSLNGIRPDLMEILDLMEMMNVLSNYTSLHRRLVRICEAQAPPTTCNSTQTRDRVPTCEHAATDKRTRRLFDPRCMWLIRVSSAAHSLFPSYASTAPLINRLING